MIEQSCWKSTKQIRTKKALGEQQAVCVFLSNQKTYPKRISHLENKKKTLLQQKQV